MEKEQDQNTDNSLKESEKIDEPKNEDNQLNNKEEENLQEPTFEEKIKE